MNQHPPIRLLTAVPICDGHDSAISTINLELIHHGIEVIYLGYHRSARDIARAAVQEDVRAVGISSYNGGHVEFFAEVAKELRQRGGESIGLFGGGGGTISPEDADTMRQHGVDRIFFAGEPLAGIVDFIQQNYATHDGGADGPSPQPDRRLGKMLTAAEEGREVSFRAASGTPPRIIGIAGPGGAGKTTLIDELVLRKLTGDPDSRIAVLSHDPSIIGKGALLGDRAAMIYCQDDRVFLRSFATRGQAGGLSAATRRCLEIVKTIEFPERGQRRTPHGFDLILVETVGIGQEAAPFGDGLVDQTLFVMSPEYGSTLQLQKIAMLDLADGVVVNKSDMPGAQTASTEVEQRLRHNGQGQKLISTVAKRHRDRGVDELFGVLRLAGSP